ncbi:MAG: hypothetical protein ACK5SQ_09270 [Chitinophagales bacterium]|jgi:hypothetical protein
MRILYSFILAFCCTAFSLHAQVERNAPGPSTLTGVPDTTTDSVLVTVVLKYQQDKSFAELRRRLEAQGFWEVFPPKESRVVSWNVALGLGHLITLKLPSEAVRNLYLAISNGAWGAFNSEVFLSYEYLPIWEDYMERREEAKIDKE